MLIWELFHLFTPFLHQTLLIAFFTLRLLTEAPEDQLASVMEGYARCILFPISSGQRKRLVNPRLRNRKGLEATIPQATSKQERASIVSLWTQDAVALVAGLTRGNGSLDFVIQTGTSSGDETVMLNPIVTGERVKSPPTHTCMFWVLVNAACHGKHNEIRIKTHLIELQKQGNFGGLHTRLTIYRSRRRSFFFFLRTNRFTPTIN